jgi:hypothetical protein
MDSILSIGQDLLTLFDSTAQSALSIAQTLGSLAGTIAKAVTGAGG